MAEKDYLTKASPTDWLGDTISGLLKTASQTVDSNLDRLLGGKLKGTGSSFAKYSREYGLDPYLVAAIAMHETGNGTSPAVQNKNNVGGMMNPKTNWQTLSVYDNIDDGIHAMVSNLKSGYFDQGLTSLAQIQQKYAPVGAANDSRNLNRYWQSGVTSYYKQLAGKEYVSKYTSTPDPNISPPKQVEQPKDPSMWEIVTDPKFWDIFGDNLKKNPISGSVEDAKKIGDAYQDLKENGKSYLIIGIGVVVLIVVVILSVQSTKGE